MIEKERERKSVEPGKEYVEAGSWFDFQYVIPFGMSSLGKSAEYEWGSELN